MNRAGGMPARASCLRNVKQHNKSRETLWEARGMAENYARIDQAAGDAMPARGGSD
ncbi:MAG: hypothetical protein NVS2B16_25900 [Chloroflexota bacterium]